MTSVDERRQAAVLGLLVADAAIQPLHWIYNEEKLNALIQDKEEIEFWTPSANPFYCIETGLNSCYGDQAYVILKSLVDRKGVDTEHLKKTTYDFFGPQSAYENPNAGYTGTKEKKAISESMPIKTPWRHASIKHFLKNYEAGLEETGSETDEQIDSVIRMIPVVALYAGRPEMLSKVEEVLCITQNMATAYVIGLAAARILEHIILHGKISDVIEDVLRQLTDPARQNPHDLDRAVCGFLRQVQTNKNLPGSFQSALHGVLTGTDYVGAIHATMRIGGCNCSRGGFIGACFTAQTGASSIPDSWTKKTKKYEEIKKLSEELISIELL